MAAICEPNELDQAKKDRACSDVIETSGYMFIDVPHLRNHREAVVALADLSSVPGTYKIMFVLSVASGSLDAHDLALVDAVLSSTNGMEYGFILNKVPQS